MIAIFEERLKALAGKQDDWVLTFGDPRVTFHSKELLPVWEIIEAFRETRGQAFRCVELAGPLGYFAGMFDDEDFVVVAECERMVEAVAEMRRALEKAARALDEIGLAQVEKVELF